MLRRIFLIARRDYIAAVFTKGFIIGLILAPLLMSGGLVAIPMMKHVEPAERRILILDPSGTLDKPLSAIALSRNEGSPDKPPAKPAIVLEFEAPNEGDPAAQRLHLADRIRAGSLNAFVDISPEAFGPPNPSHPPLVQYYAQSSAMDETRGWIERALSDEIRTRRFTAAGIDPAQVRALNTRVEVQGMTLPSRDKTTGQIQEAKKENPIATILVPMVAILAMMMLVMMGAMPLLQSVLEEKSQRIAEVLLGCASPWEIMAGKLIGGVCVTLTALVFYGGAGTMALGSLALTGIVPLAMIPWFLAFAIAAVLMYGSLALALGSACSDTKDAQHLQMPVMMPILLPVLFMMPILKEPSSPLATALSLFPPFTPLLMVLRLGSPAGVPAWQAWTALAGVLITTALTIGIAGRIFRVGILMQGKLPKFSEILRWGLKG